MQTEATFLLTPQPKPCWFRHIHPKWLCDNGTKPLRVANASTLRAQIERYVALAQALPGDPATVPVRRPLKPMPVVGAMEPRGGGHAERHTHMYMHMRRPHVRSRPLTCARL